jgi:membrane protease YdiL (CAAX protease family)
VVGGLLASGGAAVAEEVWVRLGVMTVLMWLLARGSRSSPVRPAVAWSANLIAAFAFGLLHLPQLAQYGAASGIGISGTMLGNGIVGLAYGWLYWRHSLLAAMLGHFAVDLVLHVFTAL